VKRLSWQVLYVLMPHEPVVQREHWYSYVVLPYGLTTRWNPDGL
jgi:hypothetical protein